MSNFKPVVTLLTGALLVAGCQQMPPPAPAPVAPPPPVEPAAAPEAPPPAPVVVPYPPAQIPKALTNVLTLLDNGREDQAKSELERILAGDPANAKARHLMAQITGDPVAMLGKESFPYTVRASDSMSSIAGRFLGDISSFWILARYNAIPVPRQLGAGQVLRIPGKAPPASALQPPPAPPRDASPPVAAPEPAPAPPPPPAPPAPGARALQAGQAAEARGDIEGAYGAYQQAAAANEPGAAAKADATRKRLVQKYSLGARTAFARQDLDGAIRGWESVLAVDPANETAKLERQRALTLKAKVDSLKK
jgi:tetratricopeptide (TPR) repeat protein